ncbi:flagellar basal body rod protein FlgB [Litorisediminicola beolgyonensis]|uniref:Flagellar basal body rod protein FlgB n=1 Tax=Litorisediminicola beolgyonensis TaxID=1173614 RepID=A0ABW3ZFP3_9RHOB
MASRQHVLSENIANADTPGYRARDVAPFEDVMRQGAPTRGMTVTRVGHIDGGHKVGGITTTETADGWEQSIDGNSVVLEEQIVQATETEDAYRLAADLYRKGYQLMNLAATGQG